MSLDNFKKQTITWDMINQAFEQPIQIMEGDVNARTLLLKITDNGSVLDLTGYSVKLTYQYMYKSQSGFIMLTPSDISKGEFTLIIPTEMTVSGLIKSNLILLNESLEQVIVSKNLTFISDNSTVTDLAQEVNNKIDDFTKLLLENMPQVMRSELNDLHAKTDSNTSNIELKANLADVTSLQNAMTNLQNEVEAFGITPENLVTIKSLLDAIASNASESEVVELINSVNVLTSNISLMSNGDYSPKANQTDLESLRSAVNNQSATISTKANQTDLNKVNEEILKLNTTTSTIDNKVSSLSSGAPKAVSLVSSMTDKTKNYVYTGTEPGYTSGNWYYWSGTAWTSGGTYQAAGIGDKTVTTSKLVDSSVTPLKTNFLSNNPNSFNLFDKQSPNNLIGKIFNESGVIQDNGDYNYTHSIPCKPGDIFIVGTTSKYSIGYAGVFDGDNWISTVYHSGSYWKVPTNVTVTSIRFAIPVSIFESAMVVLMPNVLPKEYIPFNFLLDDKIKLDYANLENVSVEENDVNFLSENQGLNKFDLNNTQPFVIDQNKVYIEHYDGFISTNNILVKNGDVVNWNFSGYGWVLDGQKNPIEYMAITGSKSTHTISNVNASFVIIAISTSDVARGMVTINEPIPASYQPFHSFYELADNIIINESNIIKSQTNETQNPISGKIVSIIGDSYSAFTGWVPEGNSINYNGTYNGVASVSNMWWFKVIQKFNMSLMLNESWSGSTICNTGHNASDVTATSFLTRITNRYGATNTLGQKPQVLFILGGLNDSWAGSPLGTAKYSNWTIDDLKTVLGAYSKMINDILLYNPGIEIINFEYEAVSQEIRDGKALICEHFGVKNVPISTVDSLDGHPTTSGMQQIADQIITALNV